MPAALALPFLFKPVHSTPEDYSGHRYIAGSFSELVDRGLNDPLLTAFEREVLERAKLSGRIEQADYDEAFARFDACMESSGEPVKLVKLSNGLFRIETTPLDDGETVQSAMAVVTGCETGTTLILADLYGIQQGNPDLLADPYAVARNCLATKGLVGPNYTHEDLQKAMNTPSSPWSSLEDRLPFDPYGDEAQACFVGANMALGKA
ncbi:hypothetical protein [Paenarthrobacter sp. NPDC018779]|uniref:hypothetical protein n=1 Tax=Paenarthrobacter sp. NPDC018779 TaxID=3364375 RepID=UPI0037C8E6AA